MRADTERYLERLCDRLTVGGEHAPDRNSGGIEPFGLGNDLRFSPTRTKAVMRELSQHNLVDLQVAAGSDGRNELRMRWNGETEHWYARILRQRQRQHQGGSAPGDAVQEHGAHAEAANRTVALPSA